MIKSATLTVCDEAGNARELCLSKMQLLATLKILGISASDCNHIACYSDNTLGELFSFNGNPLRLQEGEVPKS